MTIIKQGVYAFMILSSLTQLSSAVSGKSAAPAKREIVIDANNVIGTRSPAYKICIGAGRANEGLRADWQEQLREMKKACDFQYIRMHGLLHDDMGVYREDPAGNPVYNWQYIDKLYDFLLSIGIRPFVELSFMPNDLADWQHEGMETIFWWKGIIKPPKSYERWGQLMQALAQHFTDRYGVEEVKKWYFEVWNEPNLNFFWAGSQQEYFKLYQSSVTAIRAVCPDYRVGGPATAGNGWIQEMIDFCVQNNVPIDFIATHDYGVDEGYLDDTGYKGTVLNPDPNAVKGNMIRSRQIISQSALPNLELHYTEWSASYTPTDYIHDTYQEASYILDKIKGAEKAVTSMSYWVFTDIFEEAGVRMTPFHGGFGLMNYQGLQKPAFYAYKFLQQLSDQELANQDKSSWACKDDRGDVQVLLWDFTTTPNPDSVNNQIFYKQEQPAKDAGVCTLKIANMQSGKYVIEVCHVGYRHNDVYTAYLDMGAPSQLSLRQEQLLRSLSSGEAELRQVIEVTDLKPFQHSFTMKQNDVYLVKLRKI